MTENTEKVEFSKSLRGYSVSEVDRYVKKLTESYAEIYREKAALEAKLEDLTEKYEELSKLNHLVEDAKRQSSEIIQSAYESADGILFSVKPNCDNILKSFRKKIDEQKELLSKSREQVVRFQKELFEKYKVHIELIEQLRPLEDEEEELTADEYVGRVVSTLKRGITAEYGLTVNSVGAAQTAPEASEAKPQTPAVQEKADGEYDEIARQRSVMEMLDEYEKREAQNFEEDDGVQLALDIDAGTPAPAEN
ncbi:MAG: DivIVA domain-containing protein [Clostridiales bacterium]|nr:DivIVA domain-containing protein [Clostridiales bacterium]